jgi:serine/threonine protein kinase/tetratricopeptide (TPR) repeat protein
MDKIRWGHISRLYHEARARSGEEQQAFLDEACEGDELLRREVESLLANEVQASGFLASPDAAPFASLRGFSETTLTTVDAPAPGRMFGRYRIERLLGSGGMGRVFLAYDPTLHRHVAVKTLEREADDATHRNRLLREARSAAALNHPNICTIHEVGDANGSAFIAMEYVEGRSLRDRLDEGALPLNEFLYYGTQASDALAYAHDHGVVHRDFKAANVMVMASGRLKIVDFGLARRDDALMTDATTQSSLAAAAGTPYAMSPEQVCGQATDARTDIWALGVLLHEMASGRRPFQGATAAQLFSSILHEAPAPLPSHVPRELQAVIERCLEKAPERRYQHASEVRAALEKMPTDTVATWTPWFNRLARSRWVLAATSLVATAAVLVALNVAGVRDWLMGSAPERGIIKLAVLPLENLTGDPAQEYLSEGLADEVVTLLSRLRSQRLSVSARTSSMVYKGTAKPLGQIGQELNVNTVLKGSVTRFGDRVRVFAELVRTSNAQALWSETYERGVNNLVMLPHEISNAVCKAIRIEQTEPEQKDLSAQHKVNSEAYDFYLRGLSHTFRDNEQDIDLAISLLEQSAAHAPTFVPAQAYLAMMYGTKSSAYRPSEPQWEEKGFAAAQKALSLDSNAAEAYYAQGMMLWRPSRGFPSREALLNFRKAVTIRPNFDEAWHMHAAILMHVGHLDAATREIQKALEFNPGNTVARIRFAPIYVFQQRFEDAIAALNRLPHEATTSQWAYYMPWALISLGRLDDAGRVVTEALKSNPADPGGLLHSVRAMLRAKRGDREGAEADVGEATRIGKNFLHFHHTAYSIGAVYATLGEFDRAQEWIEQAANNGFPNYTYFETDVHLARLRATPRFRSFLAKLRREWEHIPGESN